MSPILTRPVREQLEHDRVIRLLQARYKRKHDVVMNPGPEQNQSVMVGELAVFPDLLLYSTEKNRKLEGTVEVETGESVNQLEALAEWGVSASSGCRCTLRAAHFGGYRPSPLHGAPDSYRGDLDVPHEF